MPKRRFNKKMFEAGKWFQVPNNPQVFKFDTRPNSKSKYHLINITGHFVCEVGHIGENGFCYVVQPLNEIMPNTVWFKDCTLIPDIQKWWDEQK